MFPLTTQGFDELLCEGVGWRQNRGREGEVGTTRGSGQIHHPHGLTRVFIHQPALTNTTHQQRPSAERQSLSLIVGNFSFHSFLISMSCRSLSERSHSFFVLLHCNKRHSEMAVKASGVSTT